MKKISAVIRPSAFDRVHQALEERGIGGLTVIEVASHSHDTTHLRSYRGAPYTVDADPTLLLEVVASDIDADPIAQVIVAAARIGRDGDGTVSISSVDEVIRVRTGERGLAALSSAATSAPAEREQLGRARPLHG